MVLAVIVGIGSTLFSSFASSFASGDITIEQALSTVLGAVALFGLGIFGPGIAAGLISGAPQLGAGAAVGTVGAAAAPMIAGGVAAGAGARAAVSGSAAAVRSGASVAGAATTAYTLGRAASGQSGLGGALAGAGGIAQAGGDAVARTVSAPFRSVGDAFQSGQRAAFQATGGTLNTASPTSGSSPSSGSAPSWARRMRTEQSVREAAGMTARAIRDGDRPASADAPRLRDRDDV